jgi:hypothetical protein
VRVRKKVTHQGSLSGGTRDIVGVESKGAENPTNSKMEFDESGRIRCSVCAVSCGPFARNDFMRRRMRSKGGRDGCFKGNRIRDSSTVIR